MNKVRLRVMTRSCMFCIQTARLRTLRRRWWEHDEDDANEHADALIELRPVFERSHSHVVVMRAGFWIPQRHMFDNVIPKSDTSST